MANLGPIGNAIYVNQQIASVASDKTAQLNRFDLQNLAAAESANAKQKEVEEVRPAEESHELDPDREHQRDQSKREQSQQKKEDDHNASNEPPLHHLDITV